jgi:hypothetical protein
MKKGKYYSVFVDCTPDIPHREEMPQIVGYAKIDNGIVSTYIGYSFVDFVKTKEKSGRLAE